MKTKWSFGVMLLAVVTLASCVKNGNETPKTDEIQFSLTANIGDEAATRTHINDGQANPKWEEGDAIGVFVGTIKNARLTGDLQEGGKRAIFSGSVSGSLAAGEYTLIIRTALWALIILS